jgi:hypothetical protein
MSKITKKAETAAVAATGDVKTGTGTVVPEKKKLTPVKKETTSTTTAGTAAAPAMSEDKAKEVIANMEKADLKAEVKVPAPVRPEMPANFCMEKADWDGSGVCYDPNSNNCKTCTKDFPETTAVCVARATFLGVVVKTAKTKKSGEKAVRVNKNGKKPQSVRIDELLKTGASTSAIIDALAPDFGGDNEPAKSAAKIRLESHLKAIRTGTYCRAEAMKPFIGYLAAAAPVAAAVS